MLNLKKRAVAIIATVAALAGLSVSSAVPASASPFSDHVAVVGHSCGGSSVAWVAYSGGSSTGSVDGIGNKFVLDIYGVPAIWGTKLFMTIKCQNGSWHDANVMVYRPLNASIWQDIGWV